MRSIKMVPINDYVALKMEVDRLNDLVLSLSNKLSEGQRVKPEVIHEQEKAIIVSSNNMSHYIKVVDIAMIKAESNYSYICLVNGESLFTSKTLKYWQEKCNASFLNRMHKSYLVNNKCILSFEAKSSKLQLMGGHTASYTESGRKMLIGLKRL